MKNKNYQYSFAFIFLLILINFLLITESAGTEIVVKYATPKNNPTGLAWDGEFLWLAHDQGYDKGLITKINPNNGQVIYSFDSPGREPRGLAWGNNYLWIVDEQDYNSKIFKIDPNEKGKIIEYLSLDSLNIDQPIGLAFGGNHLWVVDGADNKIYNIDLLEKTYYPINSPTRYPKDLAWDGENLFVASGPYDKWKIYKVNPIDGRVLEEIDLPGNDPHVFGLEWDGNYLWMVDDNNELIYKLKLNSIVDMNRDNYSVVKTYKTSETSPSIKINKIEPISNSTYIVEGSAFDADGIKSVKANGILLAGTNQFSGVVNNFYGDTWYFDAEDNSGNKTQQEIKIIKSSNNSESPKTPDPPIGPIILASGAIIAALIGVYLKKKSQQ